MNAAALNDLLKRFVADSDDLREYLRTPILRGEWVYATNGHIVIRVPRADGITASDSKLLLNLSQIFDDNRRDTFVDLQELPPAEACKVCGGDGIAYKCKSCDGLGWFDRGDEEYTCKSCGGDGQTYDQGADADKEPCGECGGDGKRQYQPVAVGNTRFARRYLDKIVSLPGLRFAPHPSDELKPAYFTFDGGEGLLMAMRR